jgi:hypothetical protein
MLKNFLGRGVLPQTPPIHAWYIGHTRGLQPLLSPSNILSHRKVPFQKMPPHGKILKKGPAGRSEAQMFCVPFNNLTVLTVLAVFMESAQGLEHALFT